jgi:hypothetical protein
MRESVVSDRCSSEKLSRIRNDEDRLSLIFERDRSSARLERETTQKSSYIEYRRGA